MNVILLHHFEVEQEFSSKLSRDLLTQEICRSLSVEGEARDRFFEV